MERPKGLALRAAMGHLGETGTTAEAEAERGAERGAGTGAVTAGVIGA